MSGILHIRKKVLNLSQDDFAAVAKVTQGTVSKWESGVLHPDRAEMVRIRDYAISQGLRWRDSWFFEKASQ